MKFAKALKYILFIGVLLLLCTDLLPMEWSDDPAEIKAYNRERKKATEINTIIVEDLDHLPPPTISEWLYKNNFKRQAAIARDKSELPPGVLEKFNKWFAKHPPEVEDDTTSRAIHRERPEPGGTAETMDFSDDIPVRIDYGPERQPSIASDDDGRIFAVWAEHTGTANAILCSRSTDGGLTWSDPATVDNIGTNYFPVVDAWGSGYGSRVHVAYNFIDYHVHNIVDFGGGFLGVDTVWEGDVYYCRSNNAGRSFGGFQAIANNDIDLSDYGLPSIPGVPTAFHYDEGGADISVDDANNVYVSYYNQSDEGHLLNIGLWILYLIIYYLITGGFGLPPIWFSYNWYCVEMRCSSNGGINFGGAIEVKEEWFLNYSYNSSDVFRSGSEAIVHIAYTDLGIAIPLFPPSDDGEIYFKTIGNPLYHPHTSGERDVTGDGYVAAGGLVVDYEGNPKIGYTRINSSQDDVMYAHSTNHGYTFISGIPIAATGADEFEPRLAVDYSNAPFLAWTDSREGSYDIYTVWSEDGGLSFRPDQHRVNTYGWGDQVVPGISVYLSDCERRMDIDWWDMRSDEGDIYYSNAKWWRTNLNIVLNDTLAHSMGGTLTLTYYSFGTLVTTEVSTGLRVVYHDSLTTITLDQMSSGSGLDERWIWSMDGPWSASPTTCGNTYTIVYYNQLKTTFTVNHANTAACVHTPPTGIDFTYWRFDTLQYGSTVETAWANVAEEYHYQDVVPESPVDERWFCPEPIGLIMDPVVDPPFYHQWTTPFLDPIKRNNEFCTHDVPHFELWQRYHAGVNVGGTTEFYDLWTDCGSYYQYEDPKNMTDYQRWDITARGTGIIVDLTPVEPDVYHQWTPIINLIGPGPGNTVWTEDHTQGGLADYDIDLWGTYSDWTDCGTKLTFSEFTSLGWIARDPRSWEHVTGVFTASIRYGNVVIVVLENDFGFGIIGADSLRPSSPFLTGWEPHSEHIITAVSPQVFGHTRYVFDHWSDGGDSIHAVVPISDTTFTAYFNLQYLLELVSDHGSPVGGGWYNEGAAATFYVNSFDSAVGGIRHIFNGWVGDGRGSYTGPDTGATVIMDNPITETADWNTQFFLEVTYVGCDTFVPFQTGEGWFNDATHDSITTDTVAGEVTDSVRYRFSHWVSFPEGATFGDRYSPRTDIYLNRPYEARAVYVKQYRFWVFNPGDYDTPDPAAGGYWITDGDTVEGTVTSPWDSMYCIGYDGTGSLTNGTRPEFNFVIEEPSSVTWLWGTQFILDVVDTTGWLLFFAHAYPPAGTTYYIPGTIDVGYVDSIISILDNRYYCLGYDGEGAIGDGDSNIVIFTMTESSSLEWLWAFQHKLIVRDSIVAGIPDPHFDSPDPGFGEHWYTSGTEIVGTIDPVSDDYRCIGYYGTGSLPSGPGSGFTFNIEAPSEVIWLWVEGGDVESLLVYSDHGTCVPPGSPEGIANYFIRGTVLNAWTTMIDDGTEGTRYICIGWTGTGCVPASGTENTVTIDMDSSGTLTWNWKTQYRLLIINPGDIDSPSPSAGEHWYDSGTIIRCYVTSPDTIAPDSIMYCLGFTYSGRSLSGADTTLLDFVFTLIDPTEITWIWESYMVPLIVFSAHGEPSPAGTTYYIPGSELTALVNTPAYDAVDGIRHLCTGFTGTGSVPASGTGSYVNFMIEDTSTITWLWHTQYRLRIECWSFYPGDSTIYGNPFPTVGDHWYDVGATVNGVVRNPDPYYADMVCIGFNGTGAAPPTSPQTDFEFDLTEPSTVTWLWYPDSMCAKLTIVSEYDDPHPYGITYWLLGSTVNAEVDSIVIIGELRVECIGYHGYGSIDSSGTDNNVTFDIWEDTYLVWDWTENMLFTVENPRGYGIPNPPVGTYSFPVGSFVSGEMNINPDIDPFTGDTFYCIGYWGTGDLPPVSPQTDFSFIITEHSSINWRWAPVESVASLIVVSEYDDPHPYGTTYWLIGSMVNAAVDSFVEITPGIRAYCRGWTGTGSVRDGLGNSFSFPILVNSTITWQWEINYKFELVNEGGYDTPVPPPGVYWYPDSALVEGYMTDNPAGPLDTMYCIGYEGTGSVPARSHQIDFSFYINEPSTLTWLWACEHCVAQLIVVSDHDDPHPYGTTYWLIGENVVAEVESLTELIDSSEAYLCLGWEGTGSVDRAGDTYWTTFDIFVNSTITWLWSGMYFIDLDYTGCPIEPEQEGEGWYLEGDTVEIYSETPVYDETADEYWGFVWWSSAPAGANIEDTMLYRTNIIVDGSYDLTAHYNPAIYHIVQKDPLRDVYGWIQIDDFVYESTAVVSTWWGISSVHTIGVSEYDTAVASRFLYDHWSDSGERIHVTDPVPGGFLDTTYYYTAYYTALFMCPIFKNPLHDCGFIYVDGTTYDTVSSVIQWWMPGSIHDIGVSTPDYCDTMAYFYTHWSDSGDTFHTTDTITGPTAFVAYYDTKYRLMVRKEPPESYGWISFDDDTIDLTSEEWLWVDLESEHNIGVSEYDLGPPPRNDSVYIFLEWEDDSTAPRMRDVGPIDGYIEKVAKYMGMHSVLACSLNKNYWDLDTMELNTIEAMELVDMIKIWNSGNVPFGFGLKVNDVWSVSLPDVWEPSYSPSHNRFVLRARFNDNYVTPADFSPSLDLVKNTLTWASLGETPNFGEGGVLVYPPVPEGRHPDPQSTENLWMQFLSPVTSIVYNEEVTIEVLLLLQVHLP